MSKRVSLAAAGGSPEAPSYVHRRRRGLAVLVAVAGLAIAAPGTAQEPYTFVISALGGVGGAFDDGIDTGFGNTALQLNLGMITAPGLLVSLRVGEVDLEDGELGPDAPVSPGLSYLVTGGEYLISKPYYDSGLFLGVGFYQLEALRDGVIVDEEAFGLHLGVTGRFRIRRHWSLIGEFSAHWAALEATQWFGLGLAGVSYQW